MKHLLIALLVAAFAPLTAWGQQFQDPRIQEQLEGWKINYDVVTSPLNERGLDALRKESNSVYLVLAELLPDPAMLPANKDSSAANHDS